MRHEVTVLPAGRQSGPSSWTGGETSAMVGESRICPSKLLEAVGSGKQMKRRINHLATSTTILTYYTIFSPP